MTGPCLGTGCEGARKTPDPWPKPFGKDKAVFWEEEGSLCGPYRSMPC